MWAEEIPAFLTNMLCSHGAGANYKESPIFQIDGNFGYTAGINEMLIQSQLGYIQFLPALPEEWNTGHVEGTETVQLYMQDVTASIVRPVKELRGFTKGYFGTRTERPGEAYFDEGKNGLL